MSGTIKGKIRCGDTKTDYVGTDEAHSFMFNIPQTPTTIPSFSLCNTAVRFDTELLIYDSEQQLLNNAECDYFGTFSGPGSCARCDQTIYPENWKNIILDPGDYYIEVSGWQEEYGTYTLDMECEVVG